MAVRGLCDRWNSILQLNSTRTHVKSLSAWLGGRQLERVCVCWRGGKQARQSACTSVNNKSIKLIFEGFHVALGSCTHADLCYLVLHTLLQSRQTTETNVMVRLSRIKEGWKGEGNTQRLAKVEQRRRRRR